MNSKIFAIGRKGAPFLVITDWSVPSAEIRGQHLSDRQNNFLVGKLRQHNLSPQDCIFLNPCPMNVEWTKGKTPSEKQHAEWLAQYREEFMAKYEPLASSCKAVLVLGKSAARQVFGKSIKVTKARGSFTNCPTTETPVMVTLSPAHVQSRLEVEQDFDTDLKMLASLAEEGFKVSNFAKSAGDYKIVTDISFLLENPPAYLAVDTETTSLYWARDASVICIPITYRAGESLILPVHGGMFKDIPRADRMRVLGQLRQLLANPKVKVFGHNFKFDSHMLALLNIKVANWWMDTLQLAFAMDENMQSKSLKECVRRWVPEMAGYSDEFDDATDKSNMLAASQEDLVKYAGGDTDATYRLGKVLVKLLKKDKQQYATVKNIQMPALRMFFRMERQGMKVSRKRLGLLAATVKSDSARLELELMRMIPKAVKQKHYDKGLSLNRKEFLSDILFTKEGLGLRPISFVKTGGPATDRTHLMNFEDCPFVAKYMELQKLKKMSSTYIGVDSQLEAKQITLLKNGGFPAGVKRVVDVHPDDLQDIALREVQAVDTDSAELIDLTVCAEGETACIARSEDGEFYLVGDSGATGFWKHLNEDSKIHPSFFLHKTVTGRSSCVHGYTLIPTMRRGLQRIVDLTNTDFVWSHKNRWRRVQQGFVKPKQEMFAVTFSNGYVLKCTEDHLLLTELGSWVSLRHVYIKQTHGRREFTEEGSVSLSVLIANDATTCKRDGDELPHGGGYIKARYTPREVGTVEVSEILAVETRTSESNERKDGEATPSLEREVQGWAWLPDNSSGRETVFRSPRSDAPACRSCYTSRDGDSSHRREPREQPPRQPSPLHEEGACCVARVDEEIPQRVVIERVDPCGSYQVYDIQVEEDHSYLTAGCFSHNSSDPNFQNIPKRGALASAYRRIFVPSKKGNVVLECDLSQAELRIAACESLDPVMLKTYREGGDIHALTGSKVAGVALKDVTKEMRQKAKAVNFGFLYTMGVNGFIIYAKTQYGVDFTKKEAEAIRATYFATYAKLKVWHDRRRREVRQHGFVRGLHGAKRNLPSIHSSDQGVQAEAERQAINSPVQRFASDCALMGMVQFSEGCPSYVLPLGTVHDSGIVECAESKHKKVASWLKWCMSNPPLEKLFGIRLPIPMDADVAMGPDLGTMSDLKVEAVKPPWIV